MDPGMGAYMMIMFPTDPEAIEAFMKSTTEIVPTKPHEDLFLYFFGTWDLFQVQ